MNKLYKLSFYFVLIILSASIILFVTYLYNPEIISKNIISKTVSHDFKVKVRKYFIEKNLQKHLNTYSTNQFLNLELQRIELGFDYSKAKNLNHKKDNSF